jgi:hypothetical protein
MAAGIRETLNTPAVRIINDEHRVVISGQSRLEDPSIFYEELILVLDECLTEFKTHASIDFFLNYLNSSSSKWLFHILKGTQAKFQGKKIVTINWHYDGDDDSMLEAGEVFQSLLNIPFNLVEKKHR